VAHPANPWKRGNSNRPRHLNEGNSNLDVPFHLQRDAGNHCFSITSTSSPTVSVRAIVNTSWLVAK
jgi:hypothetical protein